MGLFDFFRRKKEPPPDDLTADAPAARCHHYYFVHYALRSVAFQNPMGFLGVLGSEDAERFLQDVHASVTEICRKQTPDADFSVADIVIHKTRIGMSPCVVIEMPLPVGVTEAFLVAAVLIIDKVEKMPRFETLRYFTLERGIGTEDAPATVLCEWTAEGSHMNYGDGPEPECDLFLQAIEKLLQSGKVQ